MTIFSFLHFKIAYIRVVILSAVLSINCQKETSHILDNSLVMAEAVNDLRTVHVTMESATTHRLPVCQPVDDKSVASGS